MKTMRFPALAIITAAAFHATPLPPRERGSHAAIKCGSALTLHKLRASVARSEGASDNVENAQSMPPFAVSLHTLTEGAARVEYSIAAPQPALGCCKLPFRRLLSPIACFPLSANLMGELTSGERSWGILLRGRPRAS